MDQIVDELNARILDLESPDQDALDSHVRELHIQKVWQLRKT
jgi:hypothetical protein